MESLLPLPPCNLSTAGTWLSKLAALPQDQLRPHCFSVTRLLAISVISMFHVPSDCTKACTTPCIWSLREILGRLYFIDRSMEGPFAVLGEEYVLLCCASIKDLRLQRMRLNHRNGDRDNFQQAAFQWPINEQPDEISSPIFPLVLTLHDRQQLVASATDFKVVLDICDADATVNIHRMESCLITSARAARVSIQFDLRTGESKFYDLMGGVTRIFETGVFTNLGGILTALTNFCAARMCDGVRVHVQIPLNYSWSDEADVSGPCNLGHMYDRKCISILKKTGRAICCVPCRTRAAYRRDQLARFEPLQSTSEASYTCIQKIEMLARLRAKLEVVEAAKSDLEKQLQSALVQNSIKVAGEVMMTAKQSEDIENFVVETSLSSVTTNFMLELYAQDPTGVVKALWEANLQAIVMRGRANMEMSKRGRNGKKKNATQGLRYSQVFLHTLVQVFGKSPACCRTLSKYRLLASFSSTSLSSFRYDRVMDSGFTRKAYNQMARKAELYKIHISNWEQSPTTRKPAWRGTFCFDEIYIKQNIIYCQRTHKAQAHTHTTTTTTYTHTHTHTHTHRDSCTMRVLSTNIQIFSLEEFKLRVR